MTIVAYINPEEVFLILRSEKHHTITFVLLNNTDSIVAHHVSKAILCLARFRFYCDTLHLRRP